jgi:hypothetical protein
MTENIFPPPVLFSSEEFKKKEKGRIVAERDKTLAALQREGTPTALKLAFLVAAGTLCTAYFKGFSSQATAFFGILLPLGTFCAAKMYNLYRENNVIKKAEADMSALEQPQPAEKKPQAPSPNNG